MRAIFAAALVASLTLALLAMPMSASAAPCQGPNQVVVDDVSDTLSGDVECGSLSEPCFMYSTCPRSCGGGPDSIFTWIIGPIYC